MQRKKRNSRRGGVNRKQELITGADTFGLDTQENEVEEHSIDTNYSSYYLQFFFDARIRREREK